MREIWAEDAVSCIHPGWPALLGPQAIFASYRDIFRNARQEAIKPQDETTLIEAEDGRVFCVETVGSSLLAATNWFRRVDGRWRMIHHQASPLVTPRQDAANKGSFH